jgi:hypothetical protein
MGTNQAHPELLHCQEESLAYLEEPQNCLEEEVGWLDVDSCQSHIVENPPVSSTLLEPSALKIAAMLPQKYKLKYTNYTTDKK